VPTVILDPLNAGLTKPETRAAHESHFTDIVDHREAAGGHNLPQENPAAFADAVLLIMSRPRL